MSAGGLEHVSIFSRVAEGLLKTLQSVKLALSPPSLIVFGLIAHVSNRPLSFTAGADGSDETAGILSTTLGNRLNASLQTQQRRRFRQQSGSDS